MLKKIGRNISILYRNEYHFANCKLKKYNLNKVQAEVLLYLKDSNGINQIELNEYFLFNKATITKIIVHLEKYNYVSRVVSKKDRREKKIFLTDKGKNMFPIIYEILKGWEDILIDNIQNVDIQKIKDLLDQMVDNITILKENEYE